MQKRVNRDPIRVLVATADTPYGATLAHFLRGQSYHVDACHEVREVFRNVNQHDYNIVVLDVDLADADGFEVISFVRRKHPLAQVILLFDITKIERAIEGIRLGAYFYLPKSSNPSDVALVVNKAIRALTSENAARHLEKTVVDELVGGSPAMRRVVEMITKVAPTNSTVLLLGESGVGKELMANTLHHLSSRNDRPFIAINCAALPEQLLESEMFGHVKGAFTGASGDKVGLFEEADGGTIFLDEIGDMALITQAKLLRVLQNGEIRPVGSSQIRRVDVRVIAATNRNLEEAVANTQFREDLYFRLNVIQIRVPPLRERMESLPRLVNHFLGRANAEYGKRVHRFSDEAEALMRQYRYPGNIRELESIIAHAVIMCDGNMIHARDLPDYVRAGVPQRLALPHYDAEEIPSISDMEARLIRAALKKLDGNQTEVAKKLGISRSTLWRKIKEYEIEP